MTREFLPALAGLALEVGACSLRVLPVAAFSTFLGGPLLPPVARAALALALGAAVRTSLGPPALGAGAWPVLVASELLLGAGLAVVATLPVEAARGAGRLVDTLLGATLGELHVAPIRQRETAIGDLLARWTVALSAWAGADRLLVAPLLDTFRRVPVGAVGALGGAAGSAAGPALSAAGDLLAAALCLGAPAAAALACADLALALAARVAPRVAPLDAAPPLRAALGIAAVAVPAGAVGARLVEWTARAAGLAGSLAGGAP